jgi:protein SCO1/2
MKLAALVLATVATAHAGTVAVDERLGERIPLDLTFTEARGAPVTLRDYFRGDRPILLVIAYARCTMLCSVVLRGVGEVVRAMSLQPGRDYRLILVGLDPRETRDEAARKQAKLLAEIGHPNAPERWPYLVGDVAPLADALGFRYAWDARTEQFDHAAVIFTLTPDGRVARYLHGARFDPDVVDNALQTAGAGRIGTATDDAIDLLRCFRFDPSKRTYGARFERFLQIGGGVLFFALVGTILGLLTWEHRRSRS